MAIEKVYCIKKIVVRMHFFFYFQMPFRYLDQNELNLKTRSNEDRTTYNGYIGQLTSEAQPIS